MNGSPILWYFADPMCSWCWGFAPVIEQLREDYREHARISLVLGGLRPGTTIPQTEKDREETLHHWHQVHERTGQSFLFEGALPQGFVYDTEPPCRAVACMAQVNPQLIFPMLKASQRAFYLEGRNITSTETLVDLAGDLGVTADDFLAAFDSDMARNRIAQHFKMSREWGIRGFPTLVLQSDRDFHLITNGWQPLEAVRGKLNALLKA